MWFGYLTLAVAFFLSIVEVALIAAWGMHFWCHVSRLGFELLQANKVGILFLHPR